MPHTNDVAYDASTATLHLFHSGHAPWRPSGMVPYLSYLALSACRMFAVDEYIMGMHYSDYFIPQEEP